jgi:hypothetical protein
VADALDLPRPNYESVRQLVRARRRLYGRRSRAAAVVDLAFNTRAADEVIRDLLSGDYYSG